VRFGLNNGILQVSLEQCAISYDHTEYPNFKVNQLVATLKKGEAPLNDLEAAKETIIAFAVAVKACQQHDLYKRMTHIRFDYRFFQ
jgi:hypothetical protein